MMIILMMIGNDDDDEDVDVDCDNGGSDQKVGYSRRNLFQISFFYLKSYVIDND